MTWGQMFRISRPVSAISKFDGVAFTKIDGRMTRLGVFPVSVSRRVYRGGKRETGDAGYAASE